MSSSIKEFNHGIKLFKWHRYNGKNAWIFANSSTFTGYLILRFRGYRPHLTACGKILRKDINFGGKS